MRLGLLGDIHGNADALRAVLGAACTEGIETLCVTGDFVGYYDQPDAVLEMLSQWTYHAVRGNHEDLLNLARRDPVSRASSLAKYGSGLNIALDRLGPHQIDMLVQLPRSLTLSFGPRRLLLAHGTPWDTDTYLYPDAPLPLMEKVAQSAADFIVLGHTHHQFDRVIGNRRIINPGSVGQPRDRKPGAAWSILDLDTGKVDHRREVYDIGAVSARAKRNDPDLPYNWTVLSRT